MPVIKNTKIRRKNHQGEYDFHYPETSTSQVVDTVTRKKLDEIITEINNDMAGVNTNLTTLDNRVTEHLEQNNQSAHVIDNIKNLRTELNNRPSLEDGKLPNDVMPDILAWEKISEVALTEDVTQIDLIVPSDYSLVKLNGVCYLGGGTNVSANVQLRINDDSGTKYRRSDTTEATNATTSLIISDPITISPDNITGEMIFELFLAPKSKTHWNSMMFMSVITSPNNSGVKRLGYTSGNYYGNLNNVEKINIFTTAYNFAVGTKIILMGVK